jgi:hypothetical protein
MLGTCSRTTLGEVQEPEHAPANLLTKRTLGTGEGMNEIILVRNPQVTAMLGEKRANQWPAAAPHRGVAR